MFRFQVGKFWQGDAVEIKSHTTFALHPGDVILRGARRVHCGVKGMSDTMGWTAVTITPQHVGTKLPVFTSAEGKTKTGRLTPEQSDWLDMVRMHHGIAGVVRSVEDYQALVQIP